MYRNMILLNDKQKYKLRKKILSVTKKELLDKYKFIKQINIELLKLLENNLSLAWREVYPMPHPLIFELGHITLFYEHHILRHLRNSDGSILEKSYEMFDSLNNLPKMRRNSRIITYKEQVKYFTNIINEIIYYLYKMNNDVEPIYSYMFMVGYLHNIMHIEVFYFLFHLLKKPCPKSDLLLSNREKQEMKENRNNEINNILTTDNNKKIENKWITINGGTFKLGCKENDRVVVWDNEMPQHKVYINDFECMEQPVTNGEYLDFINDYGYSNKNYWSHRGWLWLQNTHKKTHPYFWNYNNDEKKWYRQHFDKFIPILYNEPVVHVNYYEAEAYANYRNARLPTEEEYVYLCTNGGKTLYPWGNNNENMEKYCNINFSNNDVVCLSNYEKGKNMWGVKNLFGNCWYWTSTNFYPFDGFTIDALYDTFSYPFFYFRTVVKGCCWATNSDLIHSNYRNAQEKDKVFHFTGIRLVK